MLTPDIAGLSVRLFEETGVSARARAIATAVAGLLPGSAVNLYLLSGGEDGEVWRALASVGDATVAEETVASDMGTLGILAGEASPLILAGKTLVREEYSHLVVRKTVHSLAYLPLQRDGVIIGAIEIVGFERLIEKAHLSALQPLAEIASGALVSASAYEEERNSALTSITRLTQLYDIEKVFSSTLEMNELLPIIGSKIREMLECQGVNVWLLKPDESLELMCQAGIDPTTREGILQRPGEGIVGDISDDGEPVLIADTDDERMTRRNQEVEDGQVQSLIAVALMDKESLVGAVEAVNKLDGTSFDDDDLFVLTSLNESAVIALHNASLLLAERKVEILETLVSVSHEITSTLNLERVLQTIVNAPQAVIPYERAAIGLEQQGRYRLSAVTGVTQLDASAPEIAPLNDILRWAMLSGEIVSVHQHGDEIDHPREETRAKFQKYFQETGMQSFYAVPLTDDTGRVGILGLESGDPDFPSPAHVEILQVLAGQATVALRNAQMYKEVPFISVLQPVFDKKRKFMAIEKRRRTAILAAAVAAVIFLAGFPLPMRVDGYAVVAPVHRAQIQPEVEGVVSKVNVREGEQVHQGQVLAEMEDWDYRSALAQAEAKYQTAQLQMNRALAANDGSEAGIQHVQADYWKSEVERARELLDKTRLRSPIDGTVATPHVENLAGKRLQYGDSFAEVVDISRAIVDVAVDDTDAGLLKPGSGAAIKLNSYPTRAFRGDVVVVSPKGELQGDTRMFFARVAVPNADRSIRTGMEGRGKVRVGWYPAGYVLFRQPAVWIYSKLWSWFGF
jgi:RND family efflux transporter MFP subunit